jgi:hypothetical protein
MMDPGECETSCELRKALEQQVVHLAAALIDVKNSSPDLRAKQIADQALELWRQMRK